MRDDHPATRQTCKGHALHRRAGHLDDIGMTERAKGSRLARVTEDLVRLIRVPRTPAGVRVTTSTSWPRTESHRASSSENRSSPPSDGANASLQIAILIAPDAGVALPTRERQPRSLPGSLRAPLRDTSAGARRHPLPRTRISDPPQPVCQCRRRRLRETRTRSRPPRSSPPHTRRHRTRWPVSRTRTPRSQPDRTARTLTEGPTRRLPDRPLATRSGSRTRGTAHVPRSRGMRRALSDDPEHAVAREDDPGVRHDRGRTHQVTRPLPLDELANEEGDERLLRHVPRSARFDRVCQVGTTGEEPIVDGVRSDVDTFGSEAEREQEPPPPTRWDEGRISRPEDPWQQRALSHFFHDRRSLGSRVVASVVQTTDARDTRAAAQAIQNDAAR